MAKGKKAAASNDAIECPVLTYLRTTNRPYSVIDIVNNLHGQVGKANVTKILQQHVESGQVQQKMYGKQTVFVANQNLIEAPSAEELEALDASISEVKERLDSQKAQVRDLQSKLERLKASRLTEELPSYLDQLRAETDSLKGRVEEITRNQAASSITTEELVCIGKMTEKATKEMKARRSQCLDILDMISEGSGKNRATLMEEMGLEKDPA